MTRTSSVCFLGRLGNFPIQFATAVPNPPVEPVIFEEMQRAFKQPRSPFALEDRSNNRFADSVRAERPGSLHSCITQHRDNPFPAESASSPFQWRYSWESLAQSGRRLWVLARFLSPTATAPSAPPLNLQTPFQGPHRLRHLTFLLALGLCRAQVQVVTYHNDNARTGQNLDELLLSPSNVKAGAFGKRFTQTVDGNVLAQPLYLPAVYIPGKGIHNVVYVATGHDSLYAFDADNATGPNAAPLWHVSFLDAASSVTSVPAADVNCFVAGTELGIVGTPVIDPATLTLYLVAETKEAGSRYVFRLHAISASNGAEKPGSPVEIQAAGFVPLQYKQRGALLLSRGVVYTSWGSNCDIEPYHGWILAFDASTLSLISVFNVTPDGAKGSFWNAGGGPAADADGNVYHMSANGDFDGVKNFGDSFLRFSPAPNMAISDYFTPFNQALLDVDDIDVGSSEPLLLPDSAGNAEHPHLVVGAGKEGRIYLLDRDHLGHAQYNVDSLAVQSLPELGHSLFGSMAYFEGHLYIATEYSPLRAYTIANASVGSAPSSSSSFQSNLLGAVPSISANAASDGIVWISPYDASGLLQAYDAADLSKQLYSSATMPGDAPGSWAEFCVPTIADGKVFLGTANALIAYGLLNPATPVVAAAANAGSFQPDNAAPGALVSIFGSTLSLATASASAVPLPTSLADTTVTVNGLPGRLLYVSPTQINVELPYIIPPGPVSFVVTSAGAASTPFATHVSPAAPGIFTSADGQAAALDNDDPASAIDADHPAKVGSVVSLFFTGLGAVDIPVHAGEPGPLSPLAKAVAKVAATVGGQPATIQFAGLAPGYAGLAQVNLVVPPLATGVYPVIIVVGDAVSNSALLNVSGQ